MYVVIAALGLDASEEGIAVKGQLWISSLACCLLMLLSSGRSVKHLLMDFTSVSEPLATSVCCPALVSLL